MSFVSPQLAFSLPGLPKPGGRRLRSQGQKAWRLWELSHPGVLFPPPPRFQWQLSTSGLGLADPSAERGSPPPREGVSEGDQPCFQAEKKKFRGDL